MTTKVDGLFVAVNYNTTLQALALARQFDSLSGVTGKVLLILVDNSVGDNAGALARTLAEAGSKAVCVASGNNLGYFGGARFGLEYARSSGIVFDWLIVSNVDLRFDPDSAVAGFAALDTNVIGVVAPNIISTATGRALNPFMRARPSMLRMHFYKWVFRSYPTMWVYEWLAGIRGRLYAAIVGQLGHLSANLQAAASLSIVKPIYAGHGSMLAISRQFFERGGDLDHASFLFGEEIFVAETARRLGLAVVWHPGIAVEHAEHASIGKLPSRHLYQFLRDATAHSANTYF